MTNHDAQRGLLGTRPGQALVAVLIPVAGASATPSMADVITFPVDTPVDYDPQTLIWSVQRGPFVFWRYGGLNINQNSNGAIHAGGLLVQPLYDAPETWETLRLNAGGTGFRCGSMSVVEQNTTTGLRLVVWAREHSTQTYFEVELPFDLDTQTYDTFDLIAIDPRFADVDYVSFDIESPFVDPVFAPYIIDWIDLEIPAACPADVDGDGDVGFADLLSVLSAWGPCAGCVEDVDGSGDVGFADLLVLLSDWGPCL